MQVWSPLGCVNVDLQTREVTSYSPSEALRYGRSPLELAREPGVDIEQLKADIFGRFIEVNKASVAEGDALTAELEEFVDCVRSSKKPACSGVEALEALKVADMVLKSVANHDWGQHGDVAAAA
jgi:predicted dehydrogenase